MIPQYQVNLGTIDPLLYNVPNNNNYQEMIDKEVMRLNALKEQYAQQGNINNNNINLWNNIESEINTLNDEQKKILFKNEDYINLDNQLQLLIQKELINLIKPKILNLKEGKELLEKQLNLIKTKKDTIIKQSNEELETFKKFQIAAQSNPNLTYLEFVKSINNN